ncbi:MAG: polysaccharide export protein [Nitrospirota bacterium]|nr:polysaccharide export protein [Nitrospirota bacterium]
MKKFKLVFNNEFMLSFISIVVFVLLLLTSCASNDLQSNTLMELNASPANASSAKTAELNYALTEQNVSLRKAYSISDYKIGPEDLLEIDTFQVQELKSTVRVSAQGFIKLPLVEKVEAGGLTVSELEAVIAAKLEKYVKEPVVSVFVKEYRSQQISVLGSVKDPRVYYATGQKYLLDMLSLAGGLSTDAGSLCIIQRKGGPDSEGKEFVEKIIIDLDELLINGRADLNIPMLSGDIVQVPKSGIFFVDGAVRAPGEYQLKGKTTTFTQAISMAKGLDYSALHSDMKIYRDNGTPEREIITVDYESILGGESPDIPIRERDIIIVESSGFKRFLNTVSGSLGFGSFRVGGRPF